MRTGEYYKITQEKQGSYTVEKYRDFGGLSWILVLIGMILMRILIC
jgi:hypothetical protein